MWAYSSEDLYPDSAQDVVVEFKVNDEAAASSTDDTAASSSSEHTSSISEFKAPSPLSLAYFRKNYSSLITTPLKVLQAVLMDIEPVVFSYAHQ